MLGKFDNKFNTLEKIKEGIEDWKPSAISLEIFSIFKDEELFEESFSFRKRALIIKSNPDVKLVTYVRIRHPLIAENLYEFKYKLLVTPEQAQLKLEKEKKKILETISDRGPELTELERRKAVRNNKKRGRGKMDSQEFK